MICQHPWYADQFPNMRTVAVACDGNHEFHGEEDEGWLCSNWKLPIQTTSVSIVVVVLISAIFTGWKNNVKNRIPSFFDFTFNMKLETIWRILFGSLCYVFMVVHNFFSKDAHEEMAEADKLKLEDVLDKETFFQNHDKPGFKESVNLSMILSKEIDSKEERISKNTQIFDMEFQYHAEDIPSTYSCIKRTYTLSNAKVLFEDKFPGLMRNYFEWIEIIQNRVDKTSWAYQLLNQTVAITNVYLDMAKDAYILVSVVWLVGGPTAVLLTPTTLTSVFIFGSIATLIIPLITASIFITEDKLKGQNTNSRTKILKYLQSILLCALTPLEVVTQYQANKVKRRKQIVFESKKNEVLTLIKEEPILRRRYASLVQIELGLESYLQISSQILLWLLSNTSTPTVGGLQNMFQKVGNWILGVSIALSIKTLFFVYLKTESLHKPHFPFTSTIFMSLWIIVSTVNRVLVTTLYFCPSLGLFNILGHWRRELIPFDNGLHNELAKNNEVHLFNTSVFFWNDLNRWNYKTNSPPPYSIYTALSLGKPSI